MNSYIYPLKGSISLTPDEVIECVSFVTQVPVNDILLEDREPGARKRENVMARQYAIHFMKNHCSKSFGSAGSEVKRDHATAMHAVKTINNLVEVDQSVDVMMKKIISACYAKDNEKKEQEEIRKVEKMQSMYFTKKIKNVKISVEWEEFNRSKTTRKFNEKNITQGIILLKAISNVINGTAENIND